MNNDVDPGKPEKKHIGADLVIPVAALAFTIYYISTIIELPWTAKVSTYFIAGVLVSVIAAFAVFNVVALLRGEADLGFQRLTEPVSFLPRRAALFALTLGYIVVVQWGGFTLTTFAFLSLAMLLLSRGENLKFILAMSAILAFGGYLLFIYAFEVRFPSGPVEAVLNPVMVEVGALFKGAF
ncbi:MAG: hypothetical protein JSU82_03975 [Rhodospirillales bacterium]|nr:MAG: hypothetical protein JSU82_03975 [Rhodospirillales bacterium]